MHVNWVSRDKAPIGDVFRISLPVSGEHLLTLAVGIVDFVLVSPEVEVVNMHPMGDRPNSDSVYPIDHPALVADLIPPGGAH